ncbi:RNA polymerase sigma factor [Kibdelosporangium phytohabitans]|uniref:RNA polymerase subunit sigma-70 n=1 Tax=Kibdelosporangium phytohabitans TaxID=860235 RepID=A0A0N9I261_9PSEU|nr:RNA polymerase sigma factor [Kibdelosporangium phytohabitans]ALG14051.1 RNA polymerase subunit sigma-70 [Kibdelosporangium phytohabitans]MBE1466985.1 RNA polymerase sigma-70 factor (ECF subfamily) [Kibdelosporangium phytohabitans]
MTIAEGATVRIPPGDTAVPDSALWRQADEAAFGALFERHIDAVWKYCYRLTASPALAEDLAAETFCIAWRKRSSVMLVRDSALPWLYTVAGNLARTEHRRLSRFSRALRRVPLEVVPDHADQVTDQQADAQRLRLVLAAIAELPRSEHRAVELCLLGDVSVADAAELLGVTESTVRATLSRARARLRAKLEETS